MNKTKKESDFQGSLWPHPRGREEKSIFIMVYISCSGQVCVLHSCFYLSNKWPKNV